MSGIGAIVDLWPGLEWWFATTPTKYELNELAPAYL